MRRRVLSLEHLFLSQWKALERRPRRVLAAVSGGADSMVMLSLLWKWRQRMDIELAVAHVHHGPGSPQQRRFRDRSRRLVERWSQKQGLEFVTNVEPIQILKSEAQFRDYRLRCLNEWRNSGNYDAVAFAHHADDLLETRLMRLIRGVGPEGLSSMSVLSGWKWRPLLEIPRGRLHQYAVDCELDWCEDPSNKDKKGLRSWLRHEWLPRLEKRQKGALASMARSLALISGPKVDFRIGPYVGLRRSGLKELSARDRQIVVVRYLRALGLRRYSKTHVSEILKRVDSLSKESRFELLGHTFNLTTDLVWASRV